MLIQPADAERLQTNLPSHSYLPVASDAVPEHALGDKYFQIYGLHRHL
jgi:hypothetical protein